MGVADNEAVANTPDHGGLKNDDVAAQLQRTFADLRTLGESVGAVPIGAPSAASRRRLWTSTIVVGVAAAATGWFIWDYWHSLFALVAPLVWIVGRSRRRRLGSGSLSDRLSARIDEQATHAEVPAPPGNGDPPPAP